MVFLIQNSQNRDAAAMQAKLDELLRAVEQGPRRQFIGIEHLTDNQIEEIRATLEVEGGKQSEPQARRPRVGREAARALLIGRSGE